MTGGRVEVAGCVVTEGTLPVAVLHAGCVAEERIKTNGRVAGAGLRLKSASSPSAVFWPG